MKSCSRPSSLRYMGWNAASLAPTTGPNGTKPRARYSFCCATLPEITAMSYPPSMQCLARSDSRPWITRPLRRSFSTERSLISHTELPGGRYSSMLPSFSSSENGRWSRSATMPARSFPLRQMKYVFSSWNRSTSRLDELHSCCGTSSTKVA